jgi:hypothetical protein
LIWKLLKYLTIQRSSVRQFSISGFAASLKPSPFDGKNYMIWHAKMELRCTAMSCFHARLGERENLTPDEGAKFLATDNLF